MNSWLPFSAVVLVAALVPALFVAVRGTGVARLAGLQFGSTATVLLLVALSAVFVQSSYLVVPLALALLTYAGTLVFTRLLSP